MRVWRGGEVVTVAVVGFMHQCYCAKTIRMTPLDRCSLTLPRCRKHMIEERHAARNDVIVRLHASAKSSEVAIPRRLDGGQSTPSMASITFEVEEREREREPPTWVSFERCKITFSVCDVIVSDLIASAYNTAVTGYVALQRPVPASQPNQTKNP